MATPTKKPGKGLPPQPETVSAGSDNTRRAGAHDLVDLNFKVSDDFKQEFKERALGHKKTGKAYLEYLIALDKKHS